MQKVICHVMIVAFSLKAYFMCNDERSMDCADVIMAD